MDLQHPDPHPALWIAGRDAFESFNTDTGIKRVVGIKSLIWSQSPDELIRAGVLVGADGIGGAAYQAYETFSPDDDASLLIRHPLTSAEVTRLGAGAWIRGRGPYGTLGDLDGRNLTIYITKPLFELLEEVYIFANHYIITKMPVHRLVALDQDPHFTWPDPLSQEERCIPWVVVLVKASDPGEGSLYWTNWSLEFSRYTPKKIPLQHQPNVPDFEDA